MVIFISFPPLVNMKFPQIISNACVVVVYVYMMCVSARYFLLLAFALCLCVVCVLARFAFFSVCSRNEDYPSNGSDGD